MRTIRVFLCLLLLFLAGGRLSKLQQPRLVSSPEMPVKAALRKKLNEADTLRNRGDYQQAVDLFQAGYREAVRLKVPRSEVGFLMGMGQAHVAQHLYNDALRDFMAARKAMPSSSNTNSLVTLDGSLALLYWRVGEYDAATDAVKRALATLQFSNSPDFFCAQLLILHATLAAKEGDPNAGELFHKAIDEADRLGNPELVSNAWDRLGTELLLRNQLPRAENALLEAYRLRKLNRLRSLGSSHRHLGMLRLQQGDLESASRLLDIALTESREQRGRMPEWRVYQLRGDLRLAKGEPWSAYAEYRLALELVRNYRLEVPPADAARVTLAESLQGLYSSFVETGSRLYFETGRTDLAAETFEAVEENRAAALAARLNERKLHWRNLPPAYWELLGQLEAAESAALLHDGEGPRAAMRRIRESLMQLEAKTGGASFSLDGNLLRRVQGSLAPGTVLLSFHLARPESALWAVSASGLSLYQLPDGALLAAQASDFRQAVLTRKPAAERLGRKLYRTLFGALGPEYRDRSRWLLSLDGGLFNVPFAALVAGGEPASPEYLIERHSIRTISGAAMLTGGQAPDLQNSGSFVGIGDAIYNTADSRWSGRDRRQTSWLLSGLGWPWRASAAERETLGLSRLPGSGPEIEACAREWTNGSVLLEGREATKANVRRALASKPAVVHFATHVLEGPNRSTDTLIALSVSDSGREELLGPDEIGGWSADAGLVVLSGCASGNASARAGEGSMGLTRAWLMAGARTIVATDWPTSDDVGVFFRRFYSQLQRSSGRDPADALRAAQIEMLRAPGWRSQPGFWAAYFAMGNY